MKRIVSLLTAACLAVLSFPAAVRAQEDGNIYAETFDGYADYAAAENGGWYRGTDVTDEHVAIVKNPTAGGENRSVMLTTTGAGESQIAHSGIGADLIAQDNVVSSCQFCAVNASANRRVTVLDNDGGAFVIFSTAGQQYFGADGTTALGSLQGETWYSMAVMIDSAVGEATLFVDGKQAGQAQRLAGGIPTGVDTVIFSQVGKTGYSAAALIDDVRVYAALRPDGKEVSYGKQSVRSVVLPAPAGLADLPLLAEAGAEGIVTYVKDDFNTYWTHPDWHGRDIPPDWYVGWNQNGRFQSASFNDEHKSVVHFSTTGGGQTPYLQRENLASIVGSGDFVFQFDIMQMDNNSSKTVSIEDGSGNLRSILRFKDDNSVMMDIAGGSVRFDFQAMPLGKWTRCAIAYNVAAGTVTAYMNGQTTDILKDCRIDNLASGVRRIRFNMNGGGSSSSDMYIDNVAIYSGSAPVAFEDLPAPTADKYLDTFFDIDPKFDTNIQNAVALRIGFSNAFVDNQKTKVDPGNPNVKPFIQNDVTLVPIRFISEAFGADVAYEEATATVVIRFGGGDTEIRIRSGEDIAYVNGEEVQITRAITQEDRVFVPLRFIAEKLGKKVYYNENGVIIIGGTETPFNLPNEEKNFTALTNNLTFEYPTKEQIKKDYYEHNGLKPGERIAHPRMFADADKLSELRQLIQTDDNVKKWYQGVKNRAEVGFTTQPPIWTFDADGSMLARVRQVMDKIEQWVMVYQMETDPNIKKKYLDRTWKEIEYISTEWPDWDYMHFLDPSEMARCVAFAYDWMYDGWTEAQRKAIRDVIKKNALMPAYESYKGYGNVTWVKLENNWSLVCHGSMIIAALATFDDDPDFNAQIIEWATRSWENVMYQFAPEGAWEEGVTYWNFGIRYFIPTLDVMNWFLGTDYGYFDNVEGMPRTGYYPPYMTGPVGQFNYHDAGEGFEKTEAHFWMAKRLNDPDLGGYRMTQILQGNSDTSIYDMLWYDPEYCNMDVDLPRDALFDARVTTATFRNNWTDRGALFGGIHGAYNNVNHGHIDVGTFVIDALGVRWASDLGSDSYALPGYMSNPNIYRRRAEGHNTVVVDLPGRKDGDRYYDQEPGATGVVESYVSKDKGGFVIMDISQTNKKMESAKRGMFMLPGREQILVQDEIHLKSPGDVYWFMHTRTDVKLSADGRSAVLTFGGKTMQVNLVSEDPTLKFGVMAAQPWNNFPIVDGQNQNKGIQKLYIHGEEKTDFHVAVVFTPLPDPSIEAEVPAWQPMSEWSVPDGAMPKEGNSHLTAIRIDGQDFDAYYPQQNNYTCKLEPGTVEPPEVTADYAGTAEMKIKQAEDVNSTAVISLKDGETGQTKYYMIQFAVGTMMGLPQDTAEYKIVNAVASAVPQEENGTENSYDNDLNTRWSAEGIQYVDYDLGEAKEVGAVSVSWYRGNERSTEYSVELSMDGKRWTQVFRGISLDDTLDYNTTVFAPQQARYVRVTGYGNTINAWNSISETKIFPAVAQD